MIDIPSNGFQNGHSITFIHGHGDGVLRDSRSKFGNDTMKRHCWA